MFSQCLQSVLQADAWFIFVAVTWAAIQDCRERLNMRVCSDQSYSQEMNLTLSKSDRNGLPRSSLIWCVSSKKAQVGSEKKMLENKRFHYGRVPLWRWRQHHPQVMSEVIHWKRAQDSNFLYNLEMGLLENVFSHSTNKCVICYSYRKRSGIHPLNIHVL